MNHNQIICFNFLCDTLTPSLPLSSIPILSDQAQLAKVQAQHQLAQTAATGQARSDAAVAHEEELRNAQKLQHEAEEREQKANEQLQQLTAALEVCKMALLYEKTFETTLKLLNSSPKSSKHCTARQISDLDFFLFSLLCMLFVPN
jgi:type II secretory pathway component HofQ